MTPNENKPRTIWSLNCIKCGNKFASFNEFDDLCDVCESLKTKAPKQFLIGLHSIRSGGPVYSVCTTKPGLIPDEFIHVIEYSAVTKLQAELDSARAEVERLKDEIVGWELGSRDFP